MNGLYFYIFLIIGGLIVGCLLEKLLGCFLDDNSYEYSPYINEEFYDEIYEQQCKKATEYINRKHNKIKHRKM